MSAAVISVFGKEWWACPNTPECAHAAVFHDVNDLEDESPTCCVEGCDCGAASDPMTAQQ